MSNEEMADGDRQGCRMGRARRGVRSTASMMMRRRAARCDPKHYRASGEAARQSCTLPTCLKCARWTIQFRACVSARAGLEVLYV